ncbi:MAG: DNA mismatch repair endonuclease MutL [Phycisphaerae bacterium]
MSTDCRIRILPDLLVSKIAAGEVVERPASVVKELLENAIDAGAGRIAVTIEDGGKQLIRVTDDGSGMSPEELRLAATPHATSKIGTEDDLYSIATMGFRGEALASISSVSKVRIASRRPDAIEGHEVRVAGEHFESSKAAGCPVGTTVEVRDLFFNVPARRKFLRTPSTEVGHINEQLARVALAVPQVAFELTNNRRVTQNLPACDTRVERIAKFYGPELASALLRIERNERGVVLEAYVAPPAQSRATTQWQYTFVNGRYIRDRYIQHAVKEAYRGLMEPNRHGVVFLFLAIDPCDVDVNVHPTKIEVRWADANLIHSQVLSAMRETFQRCDLTPALRTDHARQPIDEGEQNRIRREMASVLRATTPIQPAARGGPGGSGYTGSGEVTRPPDRGAPTPAMDPAEMWRSLYGPPQSPTEPQVSAPDDGSEPQAPARGIPGAVGAQPHAIQMHNLYLVAETEDGIVIVDQHALHERVIYEQLRQRITTGPLQAQRLLLPETLNVTSQQAALLETNAALLEQLGIEVAPFGADAVAIHAFPALLKDTDVVSFMRDLLDQLAQRAGETGTEVVIHNILDMMACKAAVKAGDPLTQDEIDALFQQRHLIEKSSSCPHGRPTMLRLTKADLDRQFKRT